MELLFLGCQGVTWIVLEVGLHPDHCTQQEEPIDTTVDVLMIKNHVCFYLGLFRM